jgi:two-component system, NarL family, sensor kinase
VPKRRPAPKRKNPTASAKTRKPAAPRPSRETIPGLRDQVAELQETLRAIRHGEVDALLVASPNGDQVFTLQGAEHPYRLMVETIDEGAATLSDDGTVLYANRSFAEIFNAPLERFIGAPLTDFVSGEDVELLRTFVADAAASIVRGEIRLGTPSGQRSRTIRLTLSPVRELGVHTICVVATELTALIESNEALRVSEISLRQLSARLLRLQDEERRRIARDLHDTTGQKIAVLSMTLDRLLKLVDQNKTDVTDAIVESRSMVTKVGEEIRTLSYLLHPPLLDECGLASAVGWYVEGFTKRSGIRVEINVDDDLPRLPTDAETALFRVVQESLTNVHRYSGSSRAEIRITRIGDSVHLEVVDHGKGLRAAAAEATPTATPSLGVGIPGMRERIRQLRGQLDVEFRLDGTRVRASLPLAAETPEGADHDAAVTSVNAAANGHGKSVAALPAKRILIADDHEVMRRGVRGLVESHKEWSVCGEAIEGYEAVSKTRELNPDLLILDIGMPGISGIEAATQILKEDPLVKIIFFTMHDSPQLMREIANIGARGYVTKARAGNDLVDAVRAVLSGKTFFPRAAAS